MKHLLVCITLLLLLASPVASQAKKKKAESDLGWQATGKNGAVCAGGSEAVAAGLEILKKGGNAIDSAVATIWALSVTDSERFCFGGEAPIVVHGQNRHAV